MSFENFNSCDNLNQKQNPEKQETSQQRKERLVIFWLKQKVSYQKLRNLLKEIKSIQKEIEEQNNLSEDLKDLYEENKLDLLKKLEQKKQELEKIAFVVKVDDENLKDICNKYYDNPETTFQILINHLWYKPVYPIWIGLPLPHSYLFKKLGRMTDDLPEDYQKIKIIRETENNQSPNFWAKRKTSS